MGFSLGLLSSGQPAASTKESTGLGNISTGKDKTGPRMPNGNFALFTNLRSTGFGSGSQVVLQNHGQLTDARMG